MEKQLNRSSDEKKIHYKAIGLLFCFSLILILTISSVSAFLQKYDYNKAESTATIKNWLSQDLYTVKLVSNTGQCLINCEAVLKIVGKYNGLDLGYVLNDIKFYDMSGKQISGVLKNYDTYIEKNNPYTIDVPDYKEVCSEGKDINKTTGKPEQVCVNEEVGKHQEIRNNVTTVKLNINDYESSLKSGIGKTTIDNNEEVYVIIKGNKQQGSNIDWIPNFYGMDISEMAWWNGTWSYKKPLYVNETSGTAVTNYSVKITIPFATGKMNADFSDIRFTNPNENAELDYWIENYTASTAATIWVSTNLTAYQNVTFYVYYGNPTAVTSSNINTTFVMGDDFRLDNGVLDTAKWLSLASAGSTIILNATGLNQNASGGAGDSNADVRGIVNYSTSYSFVAKRFIKSAAQQTFSGFASCSGAAARPCLANGGNISAYAYAETGSLQGQGLLNVNGTYVGGSGDNYSGTVIPRGSWAIYEVARMSNQTQGRIDYGSWETRINNRSSNSLYYVIGQEYGTAVTPWSATAYAFLRNIVGKEPVSTFGTEEVGNSLLTYLIKPNTGNNTLNPTIIFSCNASSTPNNLTNITLYIWYADNNTLYYSNANLTGLHLTYQSNFTVTLPLNKNYTWNCLAGNDYPSTAWATSNWSVSVNGSVENNMTYNTSTSENTYENFVYNLTTGLAPTNLLFWYNGTSYTANSQLVSGNYLINSSVTTTSNLTSPKNYTFFFEYKINGTDLNSTNYNQTVNPSIFGLCNTTLTTIYANFTFQDETNYSNVPVRIDTSTFVYWITNANINKTYTFLNVSLNENYTFCFSPEWKNISVFYTMKYSNPYYPQKTYSNTEILSNITTNKILYLLSSSEGIYATYAVIDKGNNPVGGVTVAVTREVGGVWTSVGSGVTGDDGVIAFFVNPNYVHQLIFSKTGYISETVTHTPSSTTPYIVQMTSTGESGNFSNQGKAISDYFYPTNSSLSNQTAYTFGYIFNLTSGETIVPTFGIRLYDSNWNLLAINSSSGNYGEVNFSVNTGLNKSFVLNYWYYANLTLVNSTHYYSINDYVDRGVGISTFLTHLKLYKDSSSGFFGLNDFSMDIILFVILFVIVGALTFISGITSPSTILFELAVVDSIFGVLGLWSSALLAWSVPIVLFVLALVVFLREGGYY